MYVSTFCPSHGEASFIDFLSTVTEKVLIDAVTNQTRQEGAPGSAPVTRVVSSGEKFSEETVKALLGGLVQPAWK